MGSNRRKGYRRRREGSLAPVFGGILVLGAIGYFGFGDRIQSALRPAPAMPPRVAEIRSEPPPKRILFAETGTLVVTVSNATLTLDTGSRVIVPGQNPPPTRPVDVELLEGTVFTQVGYRLSDAQFTITSFNAAAGVRGTAFRVRVGRGERTEVEVVEGVVEVWNKERRGESIYLRGGESARISGGSAPVRDVRSRDWLSSVWPVDRSVSGRLDAGRLEAARLATQRGVPSAGDPGEGAQERNARETGPRGARPAPSASDGSSVEAEILRAYEAQYGAGSREELLRSYRRLEGSSAEEVLRRGDLSAAERRAAEAAQRVAGQSGLAEGYRGYDRLDTAALEDLHRSQGGR